MDKINKINSSFCALDNKPTPTVTDYSVDDDIIEVEEHEVIEKTGEGPSDFIVKKVVVEVNRVNRADYIASFEGDVGIKNVLKKVNLTGDATLLNQRGASISPELVDITQFPSDKTDAFNAVKEGVDNFDNLPEDIRNKMSLESFVKFFGQDKFNELVKSQVDAAIAAAQAKKEGEDK